MKRSFVIISLFLTTFYLQAQILGSVLLNDEVKLYQKAEWDITLKASFDNPFDFTDIALEMVLTSPAGEKLNLPCYYESGQSGTESHWKARFAARETGVYSYHFVLSQAGKKASSSPVANFEVLTSEAKGFLKPDNLWTLRYDNGEPFRGIGMNICWESRDEDDSKYFKALHEDKRFNYPYMLNKLKANGGNFFRTWMIYWNLPVDWKIVQNNSRYSNSASTFNESGIRRMDELVELCDSLGIHMMLALESHVGYMGTGWEISNYNILNGGYARTPAEFFALPESRKQYKNKLRYMIARYGYSPSVAVWEFFNEVDNAMYNVRPEDQIPAEIVTDWHNEMSTWLKLNDPYGHIVTTSVSHRDIPGMNDLRHIGINQRHMYKNTDAIPSTIREYVKKHKKPYVIGESGYEWDWSKNFNEFADEMDKDFKKALWYGLFSPTPVLPMSWWWEFFENRGMMKYFSRIALINQRMLDAGQGAFEEVNGSWPVEATHALGVRCGRTLFVLLTYPGNDNESIRLALSPGNDKVSKAEWFDCETGRFFPAVFTKQADKSILIGSLGFQPEGSMILILE